MAVLRHHTTVPPSRQGQHSPTARQTRGQPAPRPLPLSHLEAIKIIECFKYSALSLNIHQRSYSDCYTTSARAGKQFLSIKLPRPCVHSSAHAGAHAGTHRHAHACAHVCTGMCRDAYMQLCPHSCMGIHTQKDVCKLPEQVGASKGLVCTQDRLRTDL